MRLDVQWALAVHATRAASLGTIAFMVVAAFGPDLSAAFTAGFVVTGFSLVVSVVALTGRRYGLWDLKSVTRSTRHWAAVVEEEVVRAAAYLWAAMFVLGFFFEEWEGALRPVLQILVVVVLLQMAGRLVRAAHTRSTDSNDNP